MSVAEAVVETVLENLISFAGKEVGLFLGFNQEKEKLESMFTAIKARLQDAEEKQFSEEGAVIKDWLRKIKDVAYKLDDILDECAYEVLRFEYQGVKFGQPDKVQCSCLSFFDRKHVAFRYKIAKKMKRISERLKEIYDERTQFHLTERRSEVIERPQTTSIMSEPQVYGRKEDADQIVNFLIGEADVSHSEDLSVYPIVGLGGLGKTTLAQLIFNDERVVNHFELRIWVCVSEDFSFNRMTKAIIEAISESASEDLDLQPLHKKLKNLLQRKRYLLVLDDVWDERQENWQLLKSSLTCGAKGASILVTTRLPPVASIMGTVPPYGLSRLPENDCWELFKHRAFAPNEEEDAELVVIGKEIVKKCRGVPLAAKALGGLLRSKRKKIEWLNVKESNLLESDNENSIMPALRLSYLNLPVKLRPCFAYCAIFPKDEEIKKQYLIELWMANGFISSEGRLDAEDVGDNMWHELYWRSFFQDIERDEIGQVTRFKMHDLVHDLAQSIAEDVCCFTTDSGVTTIPEKIQHISDHRWDVPDELINSMHQDKSLRTYICQNDASIAQFPTNTLKCYPLRVLQRKAIKELLSSIGDLRHLRYLNLSRGEFQTLPESLGKLWNLLILKLDDCKNLRRLPDSLVHLKALQQLSLNRCDSLSSLAPQIGKLSSLRILSKYIVGKERGFLLSELGPLKLKGYLGIKHLEKVKSVADAKEANMSIKQLNRLELSWERNEEWELQENVEEILEVLQPDTQHLQHLRIEKYKGVLFPQWMSSPSLTDIKLLNCESCIQLPALGKLPSLKKLYIYRAVHVQYVYEKCCDGGGVFMALEYLKLERLPNLKRISREDGENMFLRLSTLEVNGCPKFLAGEVLLQRLHSLKKLEIAGCVKFNVLPNFQYLTCLEHLAVSSCIEVEGLIEALQHMTSLRELILSDLPNLESLPDCIGSIPLLEKLWIRECEKLRCLPTSLSLLTSLKKLELSSLPNLESLPDCIGRLPLLERLDIDRCEKLRCLPTSLSLLTSLKELWIESLPNLESLPDCIGSLPLLDWLYIGKCDKLKNLSLYLLPNLESLPDCIGSLPLLEELYIDRCEKLRCLPTSLSLLTSLKKLELWDLPNLESLPDCIGSLPLLKELRLKSLPNLESLPDCIGSLPLLEQLYIWECEKLRCLPTSLSLLTSLTALYIVGCPELKKRCEKETGEDWPKIAHIPFIKMDNRWIR